VFKFFAMAAVAITLSGCAPATVHQLREQPKGQLTFQVTQNYQAVYRTILRSARKCHQGAMLATQLVVQGDLYTDIQSGEVVVSVHAAYGIDTHMGIDIKAVTDNVTEVKVYSAFSNLATSRAVQAWVEKNSDQCIA